MTAADTLRTINAVFRIEHAMLVAGTARLVKDVGLAEEIVQEALIVALERWPAHGIPENPGAWLMTVSKRRALDTLRRRTMAERKHEELAEDLEASTFEDPATALDDDIGDELLALIFTACHPVLSDETATALTLRLLGGLTTEEIARAFLASEATIAQRIVRAKRALTETKVGFVVPRGNERAERLASVLKVIYLIFNEGYAATAGEEWVRPQLCDEALRLGRILQGLAPEEPEVHALAALMEFQASRLRARVTMEGEPILLLSQDRALWDPLLIRRGLTALALSERTKGARGPYYLQAAIAACHAQARQAEETDWVRIAALYETLGQVSPSPVVQLNHAVAISMAFGPATALPLVEGLAENDSLSRYHLRLSVHADLLERLGRQGEASNLFEKAASLAGNAREHEFLLGRARKCRLAATGSA
jgi:RNA polymerase sigma factor (sigma-70 family)